MTKKTLASLDLGAVHNKNTLDSSQTHQRLAQACITAVHRKEEKKEERGRKGGRETEGRRVTEGGRETEEGRETEGGRHLELENKGRRGGGGGGGGGGWRRKGEGRETELRTSLPTK